MHQPTPITLGLPGSSSSSSLRRASAESARNRARAHCISHSDRLGVLGARRRVSPRLITSASSRLDSTRIRFPPFSLELGMNRNDCAFDHGLFGPPRAGTGTTRRCQRWRASRRHPTPFSPRARRSLYSVSRRRYWRWPDDSLALVIIYDPLTLTSSPARGASRPWQSCLPFLSSSSFGFFHRPRSCLGFG